MDALAGLDSRGREANAEFSLVAFAKAAEAAETTSWDLGREAKPWCAY
jgi:hypothetical protein